LSTSGRASPRRIAATSSALVALPIAVALAVFLVKSSLALAFSLAGIVAAIRWRAALNETMDGIFMFVVIGIGLAAGAQLLTVALVASVIFNALILVLSRTAYAARPRRLAGFTLVASPTPAESVPRLSVGVRVDASDRTRAEAHVEAVLSIHSKKWARSSIAQLPNGFVRLEYTAMLKKRASMTELRTAIADPRVPEIVDATVTALP
jgi:hypothetical protein